MGEMADLDIEQGQDLWWDHQAGHPNFDVECPYCEEEYQQEVEKKGKEKK